MVIARDNRWWSMTMQTSHVSPLLLWIPLSDGVQLAAHLYLPESKGKESAPWPVIVSFDRYNHQRLEREGDQSEHASLLVQEAELSNLHGFAVAIVDVRGTGGSFGDWSGPFTHQEAQDISDALRWLRAARWCDGNVFMSGRSYRGVVQYLAAAQLPWIRGIMPEMAMLDLYDFGRPGGIFRHGFVTKWDLRVAALDAQQIRTQQSDTFTLLLQARKKNISLINLFRSIEFRDDRGPFGEEVPYLTMDPSRFLESFRQSPVPTFIVAGWLDAWSRDALFWFANSSRTTSPKQLLIGPWSHGGGQDLDLIKTRLSWFRDILSGLTRNESAITYYVMRAPAHSAWRTTKVWPVTTHSNKQLMLSGIFSGSVNSVNDGSLQVGALKEEHGQDRLEVDYMATTGESSRWTNTFGGAFCYPNMVHNDRKSITYTTPAISQYLEVVGHPVVRLFMSTSSDDFDVLAYLECVSHDGYSEYLTEGLLRSSHRCTIAAPYNRFELPYRNHFRSSRAFPQRDIVEMNFDLHPIATAFRPGERIRLTLAGADRHNVEAYYPGRSHHFVVHRGRLFPSSISLPMLTDGPIFLTQ